MKAIFEREVKSYFNGMIGYIFVAFLLLFVGIYTMVINLKSSYASFEYVMSNMDFIYLIMIPVLTMRVISEERKQKTDQLLYTLPMSMTKIVLGKYLAMLLVLAVPTVIICFYPMILSMYGSVNLLSAFCSIVGFYLLGAALIAIGMFISSVTESQAVAAVLCFIVLLINYYISNLADYVSKTAGASFFAITVAIVLLAIIIKLLTKNGLFAVMFGAICEAGLFILMLVSSTKLEGLFPKIMEKLSIFDQFSNFLQGIFDLTGVVYFLMVIVIGVFLTVQSLEKRRWN